jgi:DNA topoisomerase I
MDRSVKSNNLYYVTDAAPGFRRRRSGRGFRYCRADGTPIRNEAALARIRSLAIPPAWTDV